MCKWNEIEGLKCKRRNESSKCDKPNMALSQIGDKTKNWSWNEKIFSHFGLERDLGFTIEREKIQVGLILLISWFYLFKQREGRKESLVLKVSRRSRYGIHVWNLFVWN